MNLSALLSERAAAGRPIRAGLIGAGRFGTMFLAQARHVQGLHVAAVVDAAPEAASTALALAAWPPAKAVARSLPEAVRDGSTWVTADPMAILEPGEIDVVIDATGDPAAGIRNAAAAIERDIDVVMASVEADALAGPLLAERARERGTVYSLACGDYPAAICELVDWARAAGFEVAGAGRGVKYLPGYHAATPDTVWHHWGVSAEHAKSAGMNARVHTALIDGTRPAMELAAVANAAGLAVPEDGLGFPPCGIHDLPRLMKPVWDGGRLATLGQVEAVSSEERDGRHVIGDLRRGAFVTFRPRGEYARRCLADLDALTDEEGGYAVQWRPRQLPGLETALSVASVALRREPTGSPMSWRADVVAVAKRDLETGHVLDGIGGYMVWGKLVPAATSRARRALPVGLARFPLLRPVPAGQVLTIDDVALDPDDPAVAIRAEMEEMLAD